MNHTFEQACCCCCHNFAVSTSELHAAIDDIDDVHVFLGVQQAQELAQHVVRLGVFPASSGRWLSCARQKLWWMTPDVG